MKLNKIVFIPLSLGLMFFPSVVFKVTLDGDASSYFGFPLPWNSTSLATSLAKDIYLLPLFIDIICYFFIGYIIWRYASKYIFSLHKVEKNSVLVFLWGYGLMATFIMIGVVVKLAEPNYYLWYQYGFKIVKISLGPNV